MFSIHYYTYYLLLNCNCILISRIFYIQWYKYQLDPSFLKGVKFYHFYCHIFKAAKLSLIMILRGYCCLPWVRNKIFRIPLSKKKKKIENKKKTDKGGKGEGMVAQLTQCVCHKNCYIEYVSKKWEVSSTFRVCFDNKSRFLFRICDR